MFVNPYFALADKTVTYINPQLNMNLLVLDTEQDLVVRSCFDHTTSPIIFQLSPYTNLSNDVLSVILPVYPGLSSNFIRIHIVIVISIIIWSSSSTRTSSNLALKVTVFSLKGSNP